MRSSLWVGMAVSFVTLASAGTAQALPSFSRKNGMKCSECHAIFPKLTPAGRRFKENGYRLPDDESSYREMLWSYPGSVLMGFRGAISADKPGREIGLLEPIAAGSASSWLSFRVGQRFYVLGREIEAAREGQYWIRVNDLLKGIRPGLLNVKAGQFELDLPFTQSSTYNLFPYAPYLLSGTFEEGLAAPQRGLELSGTLGSGFRYSLAATDSLGIPSSDDEVFIYTVEDAFDLDIYLRVSKTFRDTDRLGFFLYYADNIQSHTFAGKVQSRPFPFDFAWTDRHRVELLGTDVDWYFGKQRFNIYGLFLMGRKEIEPHQLGEDFWGGFAQLDTKVFDFLTLVARYSWTRSEIEEPPLFPDELPREFRRDDQHELILGIQWWVGERLKSACEYHIFGGRDYGPRGIFAFDLVL